MEREGKGIDKLRSEERKEDGRPWEKTWPGCNPRNLNFSEKSRGLGCLALMEGEQRARGRRSGVESRIARPGSWFNTVGAHIGVPQDEPAVRHLGVDLFELNSRGGDGVSSSWGR